MKRIIQLMGCKKFKNVVLTTNSKDEWRKAMDAFVELGTTMIERN
jgi:hypothetical protein